MTSIDFDKLHQGLPDCPSELALDRWFAEALPAAEQVALAIHIRGCAACGERAETRQAGMRAFPAVDESRLLEAIQKRLADGRSRSPSGPLGCVEVAQRNRVE